MTRVRSRAAAVAVARVPFAVELHGAGQVGGALREALRAHGIPVAAVHRSRSVERLPLAADRTVVVDATPPRLHGAGAEAWISFLEAALRAGRPVVTCNKAPLALAWGRLEAAARAGGVPLVATATVGGGTPVLPTLRGLHASRGIQSIEATLSGTLGRVLPAVRAGTPLAEAIGEAQRLGYCEPDPAVDLEGTDAWAKACILHNALWPAERPFTLSDRPGPLRLGERAIRAVATPAVVARLRPGKVALALQDWPGAGGGIRVLAHTAAGTIALAGEGAGPPATAATLLADVQAVARGGLAPGIH